jgi:thiol:disulfide interchange protein
VSVLFEVSGSGTDLSVLLAVWAGVVSFLSPCVLPLVPAYLGQLTAVAVAGREAGAAPSRWVALRHAAVRLGLMDDASAAAELDALLPARNPGPTPSPGASGASTAP